MQYMNMIAQPKKKREQIEIIIALATAFIINLFAYSGAKFIAASWYHYDMTCEVDGKVPFISWTVLIYFGCYIFWAVNYYLCARTDKEERNRYFCADTIAKIICFTLFLVIPTTNIRPDVSADSSIWGFFMRFLYEIDTPDNLFPSLHCLVSWLCWIGVRKRKDISILYRCFSLAFALLICVSTLTTKQHVIVDVFGGVLIAELCYFLAGLKKIRNIYAVLHLKILKIFIKQ